MVYSGIHSSLTSWKTITAPRNASARSVLCSDHRPENNCMASTDSFLFPDRGNTLLPMYPHRIPDDRS